MIEFGKPRVNDIFVSEMLPAHSDSLNTLSPPPSAEQVPSHLEAQLFQLPLNETGKTWSRLGKPNLPWDLESVWKMVRSPQGHWNTTGSPAHLCNLQTVASLHGRGERRHTARGWVERCYLPGRHWFPLLSLGPSQCQVRLHPRL